MVWWPRTVISARWRWRQEQKSKAILGHTVSPRTAWAFPNFPSPPAEALLKNSRREENSSMARVGARVSAQLQAPPCPYLQNDGIAVITQPSHECKMTAPSETKPYSVLSGAPACAQATNACSHLLLSPLGDSSPTPPPWSHLPNARGTSVSGCWG